MSTTTTIQVRCVRCDRDTREDAQPCNHCLKHEQMVKAGLRRCRVAPLPSAAFWKPWTPLAVLGALELSHSGRGYWTVKGRVPIDLARTIYADPAGKDLIRTGGHCGCLHPDERGSGKVWIAIDGHSVIPAKEEKTFDQIIAEGHFKASNKDPYIFHDDPASIGASAFIDGYDIDGDLGLRVFVDYLIAAGMYVAAASGRTTP